MSAPEIRPLDRCGAEVHRVDVSNLGVADFDQIRAAFSEHGLLVFEGQELTERRHIAFAERFGRIDVDPGADAHLDHPEIAQIERAAEVEWRADRSFDQQPPLGSLQIARGTQNRTWESRFASMYAAYADLDSATKNRIENLHAVHFDRRTDARSAGEHAHAIHPIVIAHPISGKKALYVNPEFTVGIVGMDDADASDLLRSLFAHAAHDDFVQLVEVRPGSLLFWDSRAVWHRGVDAMAGPDRPVHRITLAGTRLSQPVDHQRADPTLVQRAGRTIAGGVITAAMDGIGMVIEPERTRRPDVEIVGEAPDELPDDTVDGRRIDFGGLPPLQS